jgi:hypothetical protein
LFLQIQTGARAAGVIVIVVDGIGRFVRGTCNERRESDREGQAGTSE